jgi:hypothetical protein
MQRPAMASTTKPVPAERIQGGRHTQDNTIDTESGCVYKATHPKSQDCAGLPLWVSHRQTKSSRRNTWQQRKHQQKR